MQKFSKIESNMKTFWKLLLGFAVYVIAAFSNGKSQAKDANVTLPNIVILYADDMGFGDLAANNPDSKIPTPNLDRLAAQGMRFTDAHSSSGVCSPSRYALLTGRFHWRKFHGIVNSFEPPVLDDSELTIPEMLKQHGYRTACLGKWHLGWNWSDIQNPDDKPK
jgi:arylsulfatase A